MTSKPPVDECREAFEKWYKEAWPYANYYPQRKILYEGWQAAWSSRAPVNERVSTVEINNILHRMNLDRPDIASLPSGATIAVSITIHREAADIIKRLAGHTQPDTTMGDAATSNAAGCIGTTVQDISANALVTSPTTSWTCPDCCVNPCSCKIYPDTTMVASVVCGSADTSAGFATRENAIPEAPTTSRQSGGVEIMDINDDDPVGDAYAKGYADGYRAKAMNEASREGLLDPDMPAQQLRLIAGEMTASPEQLRIARAVIRLANTRQPGSARVIDSMVQE